MFSRIAAERRAARWASALLFGALASSSRAALAEPPVVATPTPQQDAALAQSLFDDARQLMIANRFADACPKLAESQRLDPALGTLLNLAVCNERVGKTASAWAEYRDAESVAKREGRSERESYARAHAVALEARLSRLVIVRANGAADRGLEVRLDGAMVGEAALGTAVPIDPGAHRVEAQAPEKKPWSTGVTVDDYADKKVVEIPALEDAPLPPAAPATVVPGMSEGGPLAITMPAVPPPADEPRASRQARRTAAYVTGGVGLAALAFGGVAGAQAIVQWNDRQRLCSGNSCPEAGLDADSAAKSWALASDVGLGVGAVGVAAAAYLFFTSKPADGGVHVVPVVSARGGGLGLDAAW